MPVFGPDTLERVRAASDIVDVIGGYLPLKKAGGSFVALCPFHKEKTPSFHVNPSRQIFHCFGCGKGGDVFTFVREYEAVDFPEAVRRLADRAKIDISYEQGSPDAGVRHLKEILYEIHEQITKRWQTALATEAQGQIARDYLQKRSVSDDAVKLFRLGYAPDLWDDTVNWAKSKGYKLEDVERAGLILSKEGGRYYDRFRGRLMFPICNEQGRVIGFSGRILNGDEKSAKYVNSPETPIFTKSKVFFGLDKSRRAVLDAGHAIICEGQLDLIACYMAGIQNIVAPQGTAFTADHARILKRYVNEVVLCFDSDSAGQNAAVRALDHLLAAEIAVRVAVVPAPHDPDSYIKEFGGDAFRHLTDSSQGFFDFYLERLSALHPVNTDKGRLEVLRSMAEALAKANNQVLFDTYAQKTALKLGVSPQSVRDEFKKLRLRVPVVRSGEESMPEEGDSTAPATPPNATELWLLKLMFSTEEDLFAGFVDYFDPAWIVHPGVYEIVVRRIEVARAGPWPGVPIFLDQLSNPQLGAMVTEAATVTRPVPNPDVQMKDTILKLRNQHLNLQMMVARQRASQADVPEEERLSLLQNLNALRAARNRPLEPINEPGEANSDFPS